MIRKFSVHRKAGDTAPEHLTRQLGDLTSWREYYVEFVDSPDEADVTRIAGALADPMIFSVEVDVRIDSASQVQVAYKRGITDNENDSIVELCEMHGVPARAAKVTTVYASGDPKLTTIVSAEACNYNIEELHSKEPEYDTLMPVGIYEAMQTFDLRGMDDVQLAALGRAGGRVLELDKMHRIREIQERLDLGYVSDAMLEALDARWNDHCAHTTWKSLGNLLGKMVEASKATDNPNVVSMFHDNAGIWDFYDGYGIAIKPETHNGPSAVSAYFGQLTKVGGVLRDILGTGLGADPIGVFEYTATGLLESPSPIAGRPSPRQIANETIRAVKEYGNTFGVPMMWSHMTFHDKYRAKPFALGGSIGLIPLDKAQKGKPVAGDHLLLIGGLTGNDGIHGASGSSAGAVMDTTSVQIGSPLEEIKFREAILELRDSDCIRAITDMGAAGVNSACGEMGEDVGVWLNTALVPLKTSGLAMWRILVSESQERMALAVAPEKLEEARSILRRHHVRTTVIGRFTGNDRYCVVHDPDITEDDVIGSDVTALPVAAEVGFDLPYSLLKYRPAEVEVEAPRQKWVIRSEWPSVSADQVPLVVQDVLRDYEVCDQAFANEQYDSTVQGRILYGPTIGDEYLVPTGYYASKPVYGLDRALVFSVAYNPWLYDAHPVLAARQSFVSTLLTQVTAGVAVKDVCLCDNFYTPHLEDDSYSWLVGMVDELVALSKHFGTPFISGKDSSAGSTQTDEGLVSVPPGVFLSALGKVPDAADLRPETWCAAGNVVVRVGLDTPSLAGTVAARVFDREANDVDAIEIEAASELFAKLSELPLTDAPSGRVIGAGGVLSALVYGSLSSGLGIDVDPSIADLTELLQEHRCSVLLEMTTESFERLGADLGARLVGRLVPRGPSVTFAGSNLLDDASISAWRSSFEGGLR